MQIKDQKTGRAVIIVAAGSGSRAGLLQGRPKQYCQLAGQSVLSRTIGVFLSLRDIDHVLVVIRKGDEHFYREAIAHLSDARLLKPVTGGNTRQQSVKAGLEALEIYNPKSVAIHDAARPFIDPSDIVQSYEKLATYDGTIIALPVTDTLKRADVLSYIETTIPRQGLWRAQTPQTFNYNKILSAHRAAISQMDFTDDASIAEWYGLKVAIVESKSDNMKITTAEDIAVASRLAHDGYKTPDIRCGTGFDVHAFGPGDHVTLCGVKIPHDWALSGHSDADAGLHALTDAMLGTIGAGDIGDHFPPSDPQWRGADSAIFLLHAAMLIKERWGRITNVDVSFICEQPKIGPHRDAMRKRMAELLDLDLDRVSVKATTNEGLGYIGRQEGIAALATVTVIF